MKRAIPASDMPTTERRAHEKLQAVIARMRAERILPVHQRSHYWVRRTYGFALPGPGQAG